MILSVILLIALCLSTVSFAQKTDPAQSKEWWLIGTPIQGMGVQQMGDAYPSIDTLQGTVSRVEDMQGVKGSEQLRLKTAQGETWVVYLGPRWFVDNQRLKINQGDQIEVRGAKVLWEGKNNLVAEDVSKGDLMMKLRNENGLPSWECCFPRKASKME